MTDLTAAEQEAKDALVIAANVTDPHPENESRRVFDAALDALIAASRRAFLDEAFTLFRGGCNDANRCECGEICTRCHRLMELEQGESCKAKADATVQE